MQEPLKQQVAAGYSVGHEQYAPHYKYSEKDLNIIVQLMQDEFKKSGVIIDTAKSYTRFKTIFGIDKIAEPFHLIDIANRCADPKGYLNPKNEFYYLTERSATSEYSDNYHTVFYFHKATGMIICLRALPELINYRTKYPQIATMEDSLSDNFYTGDPNEATLKILKWKDACKIYNIDSLAIEENIMTLVGINQYLWNNRQDAFVYLNNNLQGFSESLVKTFGYTGDSVLNEFALERNLFVPRENEFARGSFYSPERYDNLREAAVFGKMLWGKGCDGKIQIHDQVLNIIKQKCKPQHADEYLNALAEYIHCTMLQAPRIFDLTFQQQAYIMARLIYFGASIGRLPEFKEKWSNYRFGIGYPQKHGSGSSVNIRLKYKYAFTYENIHVNDDVLHKADIYTMEFRKRNYYNLPHFNEWWEEAVNLSYEYSNSTTNPY